MNEITPDLRHQSLQQRHSAFVRKAVGYLKKYTHYIKTNKHQQSLEELREDIKFFVSNIELTEIKLPMASREIKKIEKIQQSLRGYINEYVSIDSINKHIDLVFRNICIIFTSYQDQQEEYREELCNQWRETILKIKNKIKDLKVSNQLIINETSRRKSISETKLSKFKANSDLMKESLSKLQIKISDLFNGLDKFSKEKQIQQNLNLKAGSEIKNLRIKFKQMRNSFKSLNFIDPLNESVSPKVLNKEIMKFRNMKNSLKKINTLHIHKKDEHGLGTFFNKYRSFETQFFVKLGAIIENLDGKITSCNKKMVILASVKNKKTEILNEKIDELKMKEKENEEIIRNLNSEMDLIKLEIESYFTLKSPDSSPVRTEDKIIYLQREVEVLLSENKDLKEKVTDLNLKLSQLDRENTEFKYKLPTDSPIVPNLFNKNPDDSLPSNDKLLKNKEKKAENSLEQMKLMVGANSNPDLLAKIQDMMNYFDRNQSVSFADSSLSIDHEIKQDSPTYPKESFQSVQVLYQNVKSAVISLVSNLPFLDESVEKKVKSVLLAIDDIDIQAIEEKRLLV